MLRIDGRGLQLEVEMAMWSDLRFMGSDGMGRGSLLDVNKKILYRRINVDRDMEVFPLLVPQ
jgi:hypothetical protein